MQFLPPRRPRLDERSRADIDLYSLDDLRNVYQANVSSGIRLRDSMLTREEIVAEIRWRLWWAIVENRATLFFAIVAAIASVIAVIQGFKPGA